ncbi:MAG: NIPSNAP family protein, partial [Planctomycetota bacterium]
CRKFGSLWIAVVLLSVWSSWVAAQSPLYELRVYQPTYGKQQDVLRVMNEHGFKIAKSNGIDIVGAFVPVVSDDERIVTVVRHKDRGTCEGNYERMMTDPAMRTAFQAAFPSGPPVQSLTRLFLKTTDYSPESQAEATGERVFELRSYLASTGNLEALNARFRNHTMKLFSKHGMNNIIYWNVDDGGAMKAVELLGAVSPKNQTKADIADDLPAQGNTLVYFLTHGSQDAAKASFDSFRQEPEWMTLKAESEKKAGGSLTAGGGVKSLFLKPTEFSVWR